MTSPVVTASARAPVSAVIAARVRIAPPRSRALPRRRPRRAPATAPGRCLRSPRHRLMRPARPRSVRPTHPIPHGFRVRRRRVAGRRGHAGRSATRLPTDPSRADQPHTNAPARPAPAARTPSTDRRSRPRSLLPRVHASWQRRRRFLSSRFLDLLVMCDRPHEKGPLPRRQRAVSARSQCAATPHVGVSTPGLWCQAGSLEPNTSSFSIVGSENNVPVCWPRATATGPDR